MKELARANRQRSSPAAKTLWEHLRNRQLDNTKFVRERIFWRYIADFYCSSAKLIVEVDGEVHDSPDAVEYDGIRDRWFEAQGYRVLRFRNETVLADLPKVLEAIRETLTPDPSPKGRGEKKL